MPLNVQAILTVGVLIGIVAALVKDLARPDLVFFGALAVLLVTGILTPEQAFAGFSNSAIWVIGSLYIVAESIQRTDLLSYLDRVFFSSSKDVSKAILRLGIVAAPISAFLNNTPIVAMLTPRVQSWCRLTGVAPSKILIPLSYVTIVGGMMTLVGTSTNIVVSGLLVAEGLPPLGMFTLTAVGAPVAIAVILYLAFFGHRLLPLRGINESEPAERLRDYVFELRLGQGAPMINSTIDEAGLRSLGAAYLVHLRRENRVIEASPTEVLRAGDVLAFTGDTESLETLLQMRGLEPVFTNGQEGDVETFPLYEAVVADTSTMIGHSLRDVHFREQYGGVVLAIHRKSERITGPVGRTPIREGDLLLIEARNGFAHRWNARRDEFYLVAAHSKNRSVPHPRKGPVALLILTAMVMVVASNLLPLSIAAFAAAVAMIATRCIDSASARRAVNAQVLIIVAAALGIGQALQITGVAAFISDFILGKSVAFGAVGIILAIYVTTNILTELVTNAAAAAIMLTVGIAAAADSGISVEAVAVTVAIAASASFVTPIGYQTNLMVMSAGRYRFSDYIKAGMPVSFLVMAVSITAIYFSWLR